MNNFIDTRRNQLKKEIEISKKLLFKNLSPSQKQGLPANQQLRSGLIPHIMNNPAETILIIDSITRNILPEDNSIRQTIGNLSSGVKFMQQLIPTE
jgi:hypothetical protein